MPGGTVKHLPAPILNVTINSLTDSTSSIFYGGQTFDVDRLQDMSTCTPMQMYQWGFSLILLFMWLAITWLLSIFMYLVWLLHYWRSHQLPEEADKVFGGLRTAMAVTESIRQELGDEVASRLSDDALKKALKERGAGVSLRRLNEANSFYGLDDMQRKAARMYRGPSPSRRGLLTPSPDPMLGRARSANSFL